MINVASVWGDVKDGAFLPGLKPPAPSANDKQIQGSFAPLRMTSKTNNHRSFDCVWRKCAPNSAQDDNCLWGYVQDDDFNGAGAANGRRAG